MKRPVMTVRLPGGEIVLNKYDHWAKGSEPSGSDREGSDSSGSTKSGISQVNGHLREVAPGIKVVRGRGYYYVVDTGDEVSASGLYSTSIPVYKIGSGSEDVAGTLDDVAEMFDNYRNSSAYNRPDIAAKLRARAKLVRKGKGKGKKK